MKTIESPALRKDGSFWCFDNTPVISDKFLTDNFEDVEKAEAVYLRFKVYNRGDSVPFTVQYLNGNWTDSENKSLDKQLSERLDMLFAHKVEKLGFYQALETEIFMEVDLVV